MTAPVILVDASPRRASDGAVQTVRLAGGGALFPYRYGAADYRAGIVQLPDFIAALPFEGGDFGAGAVPQAAELQWAPSTKADLAMMANHFWIDAPITVRIGDENAAGTLPPVVLTGKVLAATVDGGVLKIALCDPAADLKKPLLTARYGGTGNLDGPAEWDGKIKRRLWGRVWNIAGELIDAANNIYCWADPARPLQGFDALRDKGAPAAALTTVAWQGSQAATLAALRAAVAPQGGGVTCPSIACVKWWTQPAGELTADVRGEIGTGYVERTAQIVERIVQAGPNTPFAAGTVAAASALRTAPVGWVAKDETATVAAMIEELLGHSSLLWLLDSTGAIVIREWAWGVSVASAISQSVKRTDVLRPVGTRKLGYARNETPTARGNLAAIVLVPDIFYSDGTPLSQTVADAYALAAARGKVWTTPAMPGLTESNVGDTWIGPDGTFYDRVNDGGILLGGFAITLAGFRPRLAWTLSANQVLRDTLALADAAYTDANSAIDQLIGLADDNLISRNEKITKLIPENARLEDKWTALSAIAGSLGVSTTAASAARTAWNSFLAGLSPAWNNTAADTVVSRASFNAARDAYDTALYELDKDIKAAAATVATWAGVTGSGKPEDNATRNVVTYSASAPASPLDGDLWVNTSGTFAVFNLRVAGAWQVGANALSAYNALSGRPVALADINTTESSKLSGIAAGATVGAPTGTNVGSIPAASVASTIQSGGGVAANQVATAAIQPNAVSNLPNAYTSGSINLVQTHTVIQQLTIDRPSNPPPILLLVTFQSDVTNGGASWFKITREDIFGASVDIVSDQGFSGTGTVAINITDAGLPGLYTYKIWARTQIGSNQPVRLRSLTILELKR